VEHDGADGFAEVGGVVGIDDFAVGIAGPLGVSAATYQLIKKITHFFLL